MGADAAEENAKGAGPGGGRARRVHLSTGEQHVQRQPGADSAPRLSPGVSIAFLELETDDPTPPQAAPEPAPVYFSAEADAAAQLIDAMPPARRVGALAVLRTMAGFLLPAVMLNS